MQRLVVLYKYNGSDGILSFWQVVSLRQQQIRDRWKFLLQQGLRHRHMNKKKISTKFAVSHSYGVAQGS